MKFILDIADNKIALAKELFKTISFVKDVKPILPNEITSPDVLRSIEDYETGKTQPTPMSLTELKKMLDA